MPSQTETNDVNPASFRYSFDSSAPNHFSNCLLHLETTHPLQAGSPRTNKRASISPGFIPAAVAKQFGGGLFYLVYNCKVQLMAYHCREIEAGIQDSCSYHTKEYTENRPALAYLPRLHFILNSVLGSPCEMVPPMFRVGTDAIFKKCLTSMTTDQLYLGNPSSRLSSWMTKWP